LFDIIKLFQPCFWIKYHSAVNRQYNRIRLYIKCTCNVLISDIYIYLFLHIIYNVLETVKNVKRKRGSNRDRFVNRSIYLVKKDRFADRPTEAHGRRCLSNRLVRRSSSKTTTGFRPTGRRTDKLQNSTFFSICTTKDGQFYQNGVLLIIDLLHWLTRFSSQVQKCLFPTYFSNLESIMFSEFFYHPWFSCLSVITLVTNRIRVHDEEFRQVSTCRDL